jgi:Restriction endonuclease
LATAAEYQARIESFQWADLRSLWAAITRRGTPDWEPGKAFEYLVLRAFQLDGATVRWPYSVRLFDEELEQIDGVVYSGGLACLVESKDFTDMLVGGDSIAKLRNQLLRRPGNVLGMVFSRTGFTSPARKQSYFALPQTILLWEGEELEYALEVESICQQLVRKYQICVEEGLTDYLIVEGDVQ